MQADIGNFHLLGYIRGLSFQGYYGASLSNGVSYHPRVGTAHESSSGLIIRVMLHHICNDFMECPLHHLVWFYKQICPPTLFSPSGQVILYILQFVVNQ